MNFIAETIDGRVKHDFVFALLTAADYYRWRGDEELTVKLTDTLPKVGNPDRFIPVGTISFVSEYLKTYYPGAAGALRPLNVPEALFPFAGRKIVNVTVPDDAETLPEGRLYRKSNGLIKHPDNGPFLNDGLTARASAGFQLSEIVEMLSEWRAFVFHDEIRYTANYAGDPLLFPDAGALREMVAAFAPSAPAAYTLDVAVTPGGTAVVECHRFFSCGLYGFSDPVYPKMLSQAWYEIKNTRQ